MTAPYKKRAKSGWNNDKDQSNKDERSFEKQEIVELTCETFFEVMDEIEHNDKVPNKRKKKQAKAKDILNKIHSTERTLEFFKRGFNSDWTTRIVARYETELKKLNELYNELKDKK